MIKIVFCVVLSALVVGAFYHFGQETPEDQRASYERERMDIEGRIELANLRLDRGQKGVRQSTINSAKQSLEALSSRIEGLMGRHEALAAEVDALSSDFIAFREQRFKELRHMAIGSEFEELTTAEGQVLKQTKVLSIDDAGVLIRHQHGSTRLGYQDLTEDQRCLFGLDEGSVIAAMKQEQEELRAYELWLANHESAEQEREKVAVLADEMMKKSKRMAAIMARSRRSPRSYSPQSETVAAKSPLNIKSLSDPPQKVGLNPRFRVLGTPRYKYYFNSP